MNDKAREAVIRIACDRFNEVIDGFKFCRTSKEREVMKAEYKQYLENELKY